MILQTPELTEEIAPRLECLPQAPSVPDFTFRVVEEPDTFRIFRDEITVATEKEIGAARSVLLEEMVRACRGRDCLAIFTPVLAAPIRDVSCFPPALSPGKLL